MLFFLTISYRLGWGNVVVLHLLLKSIPMILPFKNNFFKKALRYNFHTIKLTAFKRTIQNFYWVYRLEQPSPEYTFRTFPSLQKGLSVHLQSQNLFPPLIHSQLGETGSSLRQCADFFLVSVHGRYSSGPDFINKVFIRNLSSENPKDSSSIPNTCLNLSHKMIIPTLHTGSQCQLALSFSVPTWCL